ncbi:uncharacterized protein LOC106174382 [Lingula anatina]|uniref:Uncharacterized protein LOC106157531 n=1 Tax=Lingula anatina TaxID=7574 RepID=A0A1S3JN46_LINAN|nr:uncharacterized protein LOC106157531 [Lingula anatina]XP_013411379.1 uncharacterized protein LOC106174382 [Lingula anatina]|eukprot:XP_013388665.1 uncharacterized protein LOC106157531 [Lingula anatina]
MAAVFWCLVGLLFVGFVVAQDTKDAIDTNICILEDDELEHENRHKVVMSDCSKFIMCDHQRPVIKTCPNNTLFHPENLYCDYCVSIDCGERPIPDDHCGPIGRFEFTETNATTTPRPTVDPELFGEQCQDRQRLVRFSVKNDSHAYIRVYDGIYEVVSCGPMEFTVATCDCARVQGKEILYDCEGSVLKSSSGKVWTGLYGFITLVNGGPPRDVGTVCKLAGGAHLEIPHFMNRAFRRFTAAFFYKRDPQLTNRMGLVNNGQEEIRPSIQIYSEPNRLGGEVVTEIDEYPFLIGDGARPVGDNIWHHVAFVFNGTHYFIYVDGEERHTTEIIGFPKKLKGSPMVIGVDRYSDVTLGHGDTFFKGLLDNIVFYDVALSPDDIQNLSDGQYVRSPDPDQYVNPWSHMFPN